MTIRLPRIDFSILPANAKVGNESQKILFIGQKTSTGTATAGQLYENILNDKSWDTLFGTNSMLAAMIRNAKLINPETHFSAIALDDNVSGVKAVGKIDFAATTQSTTITLIVGSARNHKYTSTFAASTTAAAIANYFAAAITTDTRCPVTATTDVETLELTAVNAGTEGNFITIKCYSDNNYTATITGMTGGANNPATTTLFDPISRLRYQHIVYPGSWDISVLKNFLDARFNSARLILDGVGYVTVTDTIANFQTLLSPLNSQSLVVNCNKKVTTATKHIGGALEELNYVQTSVIVAIIGLRLTDGAEIASYLTGIVPIQDAEGGPSLATRPLFNTPVPFFTIIDKSNEWEDDEMDELKDLGGSVVGNNTARNTVIFGEFVTTYKTDSAGNDDISYKYLEYVHSIVAAREYCYNNLRKTYPQSRLTRGDGGDGVVSSGQLSGYLDTLWSDLSGGVYLLLQAGTEAYKLFQQSKQVILDVPNGKATVIMKVAILSQLRKIVASIQIDL